MKLAVVVQKMVNSDISGIMFTVDPNSEMPHIIIEAGYGLGEAIVSGKVTPDTYVVEKFHNKIINKRIAKQTWKFVRGKVGDTVKEDIAPELVGAQKLTDDQIFAVADIGKNIEIHYDRPMDIEWCIEDGQVYRGPGEARDHVEQQWRQCREEGYHGSGDQIGQDIGQGIGRIPWNRQRTGQARRGRDEPGGHQEG